MGQAKNRGSRDERIRDAKERGQSRRDEVAENLGLERRSMAEIKAEHGIPESAQFHGYAVHNPSTDEFLMEIGQGVEIVGRQWAKTPELARCFPDFGAAYSVTRAERGEVVVGIFETEQQFLVQEVMPSD